MPTEVAARYDACLTAFVSHMRSTYAESLRLIVLHGGLVREPTPVAGWSDIDLIVILSQYSSGTTEDLSVTSEALEAQYSLRLDVNLAYESDFANDWLKARYFHSEVINALHQRGTRILHGSLDVGDVSLFDEREAVYVYLNSVQNLVRRYYMEVIYRSSEQTRCVAHIQRITRWVFSVLRSSLRLNGTFVHPYQESLDELVRLRGASPDDVALLSRLIAIRRDISAFVNLSTERRKELYTSIESFVERYIRHVVRHGRVQTVE